MKMTIFSFVAAHLLSIQAMFAQQPRVSVSNDDPGWGDIISITYIAPDSSVYAGQKFRDTVYCAAMLTTAEGEKSIATPMKRSGATYTSALRVPDSTYSIRLEICIPTDRVPDGITIFTCKMPNGAPPPNEIFRLTTNVDSALAVDRKIYPWNYTAYCSAYDAKLDLANNGTIKFPDSIKRAYLSELITQLRNNPDTNLSWYFAVAELESRRKSGDSAALAILDEATRHLHNDPVLHSRFWNRFFAPSMIDGTFVMPYKRGRAIAPIVAAFPRSEAAKWWVQRMGGDTLVNVEVYKKLADGWKSSNDVDVLLSIGNAYSQGNSPLYNPETALFYLNRAEESSRTGAGFYSGENIFGSMGRTSRIAAQKIDVLRKTGRIQEAITLGRGALRAVQEPFEKEFLGAALASAYFAKKDYEAAERTLGAALATSSRRNVPLADSLFAIGKNNGKNKEDYVKRIITAYGKSAELPQVQDFSYTTLDGEKGSIAALRGKIVVLDFWFMSCAGCVIEHESMNDLVDSFKGNSDVTFLSVSLDSESSLRNYLKKNVSRFPIVPQGKRICDALGVTGFPTHIILDKQGKTRTWEMGGSTKSGEELTSRVNELLGQK